MHIELRSNPQNLLFQVCRTVGSQGIGAQRLRQLSRHPFGVLEMRLAMSWRAQPAAVLDAERHSSHSLQSGWAIAQGTISCTRPPISLQRRVCHDSLDDTSILGPQSCILASVDAHRPLYMTLIQCVLLEYVPSCRHRPTAIHNICTNTAKSVHVQYAPWNSVSTN